MFTTVPTLTFSITSSEISTGGQASTQPPELLHRTTTRETTAKSLNTNQSTSSDTTMVSSRFPFTQTTGVVGTLANSLSTVATVFPTPSPTELPSTRVLAQSTSTFRTTPTSSRFLSNSSHTTRTTTEKYPNFSTDITQGASSASTLSFHDITSEKWGTDQLATVTPSNSLISPRGKSPTTEATTETSPPYSSSIITNIYTTRTNPISGTVSPESSTGGLTLGLSTESFHRTTPKETTSKSLFTTQTTLADPAMDSSTFPFTWNTREAQAMSSSGALENISTSAVTVHSSSSEILTHLASTLGTSLTSSTSSSSTRHMTETATKSSPYTSLITTIYATSSKPVSDTISLAIPTVGLTTDRPIEASHMTTSKKTMDISLNTTQRSLADSTVDSTTSLFTQNTGETRTTNSDATGTTFLSSVMTTEHTSSVTESTSSGISFQPMSSMGTTSTSFTSPSSSNHTTETTIGTISPYGGTDDALRATSFSASTSQDISQVVKATGQSTTDTSFTSFSSTYGHRSTKENVTETSSPLTGLGNNVSPVTYSETFSMGQKTSQSTEMSLRTTPIEKRAESLQTTQDTLSDTTEVSSSSSFTWSTGEAQTKSLGAAGTNTLGSVTMTGPISSPTEVTLPRASSQRGSPLGILTTPSVSSSSLSYTTEVTITPSATYLSTESKQGPTSTSTTTSRDIPTSELITGQLIPDTNSPTSSPISRQLTDTTMEMLSPHISFVTNRQATGVTPMVGPTSSEILTTGQMMDSSTKISHGATPKEITAESLHTIQNPLSDTSVDSTTSPSTWATGEDKITGSYFVLTNALSSGMTAALSFSPTESTSIGISSKEALTLDSFSVISTFPSSSSYKTDTPTATTSPFSTVVLKTVTSASSTISQDISSFGGTTGRIPELSYQTRAQDPASQLSTIPHNTLAATAIPLSSSSLFQETTQESPTQVPISDSTDNPTTVIPLISTSLSNLATFSEITSQQLSTLDIFSTASTATSSDSSSSEPRKGTSPIYTSHITNVHTIGANPVTITISPEVTRSRPEPTDISFRTTILETTGETLGTTQRTLDSITVKPSNSSFAAASEGAIIMGTDSPVTTSRSTTTSAPISSFTGRFFTDSKAGLSAFPFPKTTGKAVPMRTESPVTDTFMKVTTPGSISSPAGPTSSGFPIQQLSTLATTFSSGVSLMTEPTGSMSSVLTNPVTSIEARGSTSMVSPTTSSGISPSSAKSVSQQTEISYPRKSSTQVNTATTNTLSEMGTKSPSTISGNTRQAPSRGTSLVRSPGTRGDTPGSTETQPPPLASSITGSMDTATTTAPGPLSISINPEWDKTSRPTSDTGSTPSPQFSGMTPTEPPLNLSQSTPPTNYTTTPPVLNTSPTSSLQSSTTIPSPPENIPVSANTTGWTEEITPATHTTPGMTTTTSHTLSPLTDNQKSTSASTTVMSASTSRPPAVTSPPASTTTANPIKGITLFPYGKEANDQEFVQKKLDFTSQLFRPLIGFPLGSTLRNSLYFTDNGQIIFPAWDYAIHSYPNPPSLGFSRWDSVAMVAAFWDDADFSTGQGTIFYQEYDTLTSFRPQIIRNVESLIRKSTGTPYMAKWTLKVTWVRAPAYPAWTNSGTNTFQAILTTDGSRSFALILYQDGGMRWNVSQVTLTNALIGFTSGDGFYKNDLLMLKPPAEKYRPDQFLSSGPGLRGLRVYQLQKEVRTNYRLKCLQWLEENPAWYNRAQDQLSCPCTLGQAQWDRRFSWSRAGWRAGRRRQLCRFSSWQGGVCCSYDPWGALLNGQRIWHSWKEDWEMEAQNWCCLWNDNPYFCQLYRQRWPPVTCAGYRPPRTAWMFGDPHITTLDGATYTFNGLGDFLLVKAKSANSSFLLQGRTTQTGTAPATNFMAFAAQYNSSGTGIITVQWLLQPNDTIQVLLNNQTVNFNYSEGIEEGVHNISGVQLFRNDTISATFDGAVSVTVSASFNILYAFANLPEEYFNKTQGLLGVWNWNPTDDFKMPNGSSIPINSSEESIFHYGMSWFLSTDSLFTNKPGRQPGNFTPVFLTDLKHQNLTFYEEATKLCNNSQECTYDALATRSISFGLITKKIRDNFSKMNTSLNQFPPSLTGQIDIHAFMQKTEIVTYSSYHSGVHFTLETDPESADFNITGNGTLAWTPRSLDPFTLTIRATDVNGLSSTLSPTFVVCNCSSESQCVYNRTTKVNNSSLSVAACNCELDFLGRFCEFSFDVCETCFPNVTCLPGKKCGLCPGNFIGDGIHCAGCESMPCPADYCGNGGTCHISPNTTCKPTCTCPPPFIDARCRVAGKSFSPTVVRELPRRIVQLLLSEKERASPEDVNASVACVLNSLEVKTFDRNSLVMNYANHSIHVGNVLIHHWNVTSEFRYVPTSNISFLNERLVTAIVEAFERKVCTTRRRARSTVNFEPTPTRADIQDISLSDTDELKKYFECRDYPGYLLVFREDTGFICVSPCEEGYCQNGGKCQHLEDGVHCSCVPFTIYSPSGERCEQLGIRLGAFFGILFGALSVLALLGVITFLVVYCCRYERSWASGRMDGDPMNSYENRAFWMLNTALPEASLEPQLQSWRPHLEKVQLGSTEKIQRP
ncbi:mucin-4 [Tachyglossus aculeatus]|uniref:mucin-4 n=1 Tax=Tachyglossus aculeatus TaxID=9261 RepID=UPI0018F64790|nr:mucin-4 [Tachyglossus aculeatus]